MLMILRGVFGKWYFFAEDAMFFAGPLAEIDQSATLAAKGTPLLTFVPFHLGTAGGTVNKGAHIMQQVSLNGTSWLVCTAWPSARYSKNLRVKRWRPPLTSAK